MPDQAVYIVDAQRSGQAPVGGVLGHCRAEDLLGQLAQRILLKNEIHSGLLSDFIVGCAVQQGEQGLNLARQAALLNGWDKVPGLTLNRMECSGLESILWAQRRLIDEGGWVLAGACEKMSVSGSTAIRRSPHPRLVTERLQALEPALFSAARLQKEMGLERKSLDEFVLESHRRAVHAQDSDFLDTELLSLEWQEKVWKDSVWSEISSSLGSDECPREDLTLEQLQALGSALGQDSILTAAHLAPPCDGSALCLMASKKAMDSSGKSPLGRVCAWATIASEPWRRGFDCQAVADLALKKAGLSAKNIDLVQVSESTAVTALAFSQSWSGDVQSINVNGGMLAYGNSMAVSGVSMLVSVLHELRRRKARYGLIIQDSSGGQHTAILVEAL
jgi:acetyl-CoA acyltransferase